MGDRDRTPANTDEADIHDGVTRRHLIVGGVAVTGAIGVGSGLLGQDEDIEPTPADRLTTAETQFTGVATTLTETDVANPHSSWDLRNKIETALNSVNQILSEDFPDEPEIQQRINALRTTTEYYSTLVTSLTAADSLFGSVSDSEPNVLKQTGDLNYDPASKLDSSSFEQSLGQLATAEKAPSEVTSEGRTLVPDQQAVLDALRTQREIFDRHIRAQQSYLDSATPIEVGVRAHEQSRFADARANLTVAQEALLPNISGTSGAYLLSNHGLTLDQYREVFSLRQDGVAQLLDAIQETVPEDERQSAVNSALNAFFEARNLLPR
ncbi:hypothetical protein EXE43_02105 [Halorubrum sp. SS5]|nr:hypothetical protein EXE43_02105 [Halorubrum sp. SS5]